MASTMSCRRVAPPRRRRAAATLFGMLGLLSGCGGGTERGGDERAEASTPAAPAGGSGAADAAAAALDPQQFVTAVGSADHYEIAAAEVALQRTRSNAVRDYANQLLTDRRNSLARLKRAAAASAAELIVPVAPNDRQRAALAALEDASDFDSAFLQQQRRAQEQMLGDLRRFASQGGDTALGAFAAETATIIDRHRAALRAIETAGRDDVRPERADKATR